MFSRVLRTHVPTCRFCETTHEAEELVRHRREDLLFVHCPECNCAMGLYREPGRGR